MRLRGTHGDLQGDTNARELLTSVLVPHTHSVYVLRMRKFRGLPADTSAGRSAQAASLAAALSSHHAPSHSESKVNTTTQQWHQTQCHSAISKADVICRMVLHITTWVICMTFCK